MESRKSIPPPPPPVPPISQNAGTEKIDKLTNTVPSTSVFPAPPIPPHLPPSTIFPNRLNIPIPSLIPGLRMNVTPPLPPPLIPGLINIAPPIPISPAIVPSSITSSIQPQQLLQRSRQQQQIQDKLITPTNINRNEILAKQTQIIQHCTILIVNLPLELTNNNNLLLKALSSFGKVIRWRSPQKSLEHKPLPSESKKVNESEEFLKNDNDEEIKSFSALLHRFGFATFERPLSAALCEEALHVFPWKCINYYANLYTKIFYEKKKKLQLEQNSDEKEHKKEDVIVKIHPDHAAEIHRTNLLQDKKNDINNENGNTQNITSKFCGFRRVAAVSSKGEPNVSVWEELWDSDVVMVGAMGSHRKVLNAAGMTSEFLGTQQQKQQQPLPNPQKDNKHDNDCQEDRDILYSNHFSSSFNKSLALSQPVLIALCKFCFVVSGNATHYITDTNDEIINDGNDEIINDDNHEDKSEDQSDYIKEQMMQFKRNERIRHEQDTAKYRFRMKTKIAEEKLRLKAQNTMINISKAVDLDGIEVSRKSENRSHIENELKKNNIAIKINQGRKKIALSLPSTSITTIATTTADNDIVDLCWDILNVHLNVIKLELIPYFKDISCELVGEVEDIFIDTLWEYCSQESKGGQLGLVEELKEFCSDEESVAIAENVFTKLHQLITKFKYHHES